MHLLWVPFIYILLLRSGCVMAKEKAPVLETVKCGGPTSEFDKPTVLARLNRCVKSPDRSECSNVTKPEVLLQKLYWHINHPRKNGVQYFEECSQIVHNKIPWKYTSLLDQYNKLIFGRNKQRCMNKETLCEDLRRYLRPFVCFMRKNCDKVTHDFAYALNYALQQLTLEQEGPIRCSTDPDDRQFDLNPEVYEVGKSIQNVNIVSENICDGIPAVEEVQEADPENVFSAALYSRVLAYKGHLE